MAPAAGNHLARPRGGLRRATARPGTTQVVAAGGLC